jgi:hypothetical protein
MSATLPGRYDDDDRGAVRWSDGPRRIADVIAE